MTELANSSDIREQLKAAGRDRVSIFTWERTARLTLNAFDAVLDAEQRPSSAAQLGERYV